MIAAGLALAGGPDTILDPGVGHDVELRLAELLRLGALDIPDGLQVDRTFPVDPWCGIAVKPGVYLHRMIVNWRIMDVPHPDNILDGPRRGWCYDNHLVALLAAMAWDGRADTEPTGWKKRAGA